MAEQQQPEPPVIVVAYQKGGVAKTTTTFNLAGVFWAEGLDVRIVDMDPQEGSVTLLCGHNPREVPDDSTVAAVIGEPEDEKLDWRAINASASFGPTIWRSNRSLDLVLDNLGPGEELNAPLRFRERFRSQMADADVVLIDTGPDLGALNTNYAMLVASHLVVPIGTSYIDTQGVIELLEAVGQVRSFKQRLGEDLEILAAVYTDVEERTVHARDVMASLHEVLGAHEYGLVPHGVRVRDAQAAHEPIVTYDPDYRPAQAYVEIGREMMRSLGLSPAGEGGTPRPQDEPTTEGA